MQSQKRSRANFENEGPPAHAPYAVYGTPLPAYDPQVRDDGSYVPVWQQEVTDERGRKRLHGAFTGGFSAGYFNTVGSKEGWTPSTFVSSRANRAKPAQRPQRAEDFMDEEDVADQAESQVLATQSDFAGLGSASSDGNPKGMFADLFRATGDTMGVKLLQRMGWRRGQGIGRRIKRLAQGDKTGQEHEFAPENTAMVSFVRKVDRKGLGYAGEASLTASAHNATQDEAEDSDNDNDARILSMKRSKVVVKPKQPRKPAFDVGVLNDTGSDDDDPYSMGPSIKYNRSIGGSRPTRTKTTGHLSKHQETKHITQKLAQRSVNITTPLRKCHDGRPPLIGFVLHSKPALLMQENLYPPPEVPPGWQPRLVGNQAGDDAKAYLSTADAAKSSSMDPRSRASVLGEQQLPGKSVFDFLTPAAREKLASASGRADLPQARGEKPEGSESTTVSHSLWDRLPRIDKDTAIAALQRGSSGWMPYAEDESKRARYKSYLTLQGGLTDKFPERPFGFSTDEWVKEMREFAQAAEVFRPISGLMATRFTTSTASPTLASDQPDTRPSEPLRPPDPAEEAAKAGMYGPLTRVRTLFQPTRLLCKRFGVTAPTNGGAEDDQHAGARGSKNSGAELVNRSTIDQMMRHANFKLPSFASAGVEGGEEALSNDPRVAPARVDASVNEALEGPRPDEQMLKSIFEDQ